MREGWEYKKLGEVCSIIGRIGFRGYKRTDYVESEDDGAISLSPSNIIDGKLDYSKNTYITWEKYEESPEIKIYDRDVLLVKTASVGKSAIVKDLPHAATINPQFVVLKDISGCNEYIAYSIKSTSFLNKLKSITSGSSVPTLSQKALAELIIPLPPITTQQQIVSELDLLSHIIDQKRQQLKEYDALAESIFYDMFGDDSKFKKEKLVNITSKIGSGATPKGGNQAYKEEGVSLIRSLNVHNAEFKYEDLAHIDEKQASELKNVTIEKNDVLFNITGASVTRCCIVPESVLPARVNQHVAILRPCKDVLNYIYLNYLMISSLYHDRLYSLSRSNGATREAITKSQLENFIIPLPPLSLQRQFAARIESIEQQKQLLKESIKETEMLFQSRMDYWFNG